MLADGMSHSAEMDQSAIETVSTINITVSSEISTVDITREMKAFFDSSWEADTFVSKIDWFVKLTKDGFCGLFLAQFKLFAKRTGLLDTKKGEFLRNFKLNMGKILMTTIASSNTWTFKSKSSHEKIIVDIVFISHAIVDRKIDAYVFDLFKFEGSKSCEACNDMKEQLDEQLSILKALKFSHEKLAGMVNKLNNSNFFKSFNYHNENNKENQHRAVLWARREREPTTPRLPIAVMRVDSRHSQGLFVSQLQILATALSLSRAPHRARHRMKYQLHHRVWLQKKLHRPPLEIATLIKVV